MAIHEFSVMIYREVQPKDRQKASYRRSLYVTAMQNQSIIIATAPKNSAFSPNAVLINRRLDSHSFIDCDFHCNNFNFAERSAGSAVIATHLAGF